jgi:hypothetical protein
MFDVEWNAFCFGFTKGLGNDGLMAFGCGCCAVEFFGFDCASGLWLLGFC